MLSFGHFGQFTRYCEATRVATHLSRRCYSSQTPPSVGVTKITESESTSHDPPPISPLRRPLGVPDVPTTKTKTLSERSADFLDQEKQLEKRRHLVKEASTGYFYDLHMTRVHGGKTWMAPKVLIREDKALYFPNIAHTTHMCAGKVSVVAMLSTKISELHAASYTEALNALYQRNPVYQYVQINLQENILKSILVNIFLSSLRSKIPPAQHTRYLVSRQNMEYVREPLGMTNGRIGYVYLVDENLKVRWAACADAKKEEEEALIRCVGVLLKRHTRPTPTGTERPPEQ
ncbi:ATP10 protein-domain-containing protein [Multifurca ochricompacta]|uniref:ATP10 protein-domain-containing protein n=1 Tax=Multifurca ochricompacta TaxID=376703 RepID=A0AAD4M3V0_9AGAM|nr:ATP10 protein-domain-containing protein [Multifurca ochricompacta]